MLVAGGLGTSGATTEAELFNPATELWTVTSSPMNAARLVHTATLLSNGKVLVTGGDNNIGSTYLASTGSCTTRLLRPGR